MWRSLFGGFSKNAAPETAPQTIKSQDGGAISRSIKALRDAQKLLEKREARLEKQVAHCTLSAKRKIRRKNKKGALFDLKRRKALEKELPMIQNKKLSMEKQICTLETSMVNSDVLTSIREGNQALRRSADAADIEDVQEVMEELEDLNAQQEAIDEAFSRSAIDISDDELLKELEELDSEVENSPVTYKLPDVPTKKLVNVTVTENNRAKRSHAKIKNGLSSKDKAEDQRKDIPLSDKPACKRAKVRGNDTETRPVSKKRKLRDIDLKGQKSDPGSKKQRLGFSFSSGRHFSRLTHLPEHSEPVAHGTEKVPSANPLRDLSKKKDVTIEESKRDSVDKKEEENLALLESLYD